MCFSNINLGAAKIAAEDIFVYKGLDRVNGVLRSPYFAKKTWEVGKVAHIRNFVRFGAMLIDRGFHSCKTYDGASNHSTTVFLFKIPAGSIYWENRTDYVSDTIVLVKKTSIRKPK